MCMLQLSLASGISGESKCCTQIFTTTAQYRGNVVRIKELKFSKKKVSLCCLKLFWNLLDTTYQIYYNWYLRILKCINHEIRLSSTVFICFKMREYQGLFTIYFGHESNLMISCICTTIPEYIIYLCFFPGHSTRDNEGNAFIARTTSRQPKLFHRCCRRAATSTHTDRLLCQRKFICKCYEQKANTCSKNLVQFNSDQHSISQLPWKVFS